MILFDQKKDNLTILIFMQHIWMVSYFRLYLVLTDWRFLSTVGMPLWDEYGCMMFQVKQQTCTNISPMMFLGCS